MQEAQTATLLQELESDEVRLSIYRKPASLIEFVVEASPSLVQQAYKKAVKAIAKEVTMPGFRKGRAPDALIVKNFPEQVDKKWQEEISNLAFNESEKLAQIPRLTVETKVAFNVKAHSLENGANLTLTFETDPIVPDIDPKAIRLKTIKRPEVTEERINETIRQILFFFAEWTPITDRPAQEGDFVLLDVDVIDELQPSKLFSHTRFEITEKSMAEWMRSLVIGLSTDARVEGLSYLDENASDEDKAAFKPKKVSLHLIAIEKPTTPPLDDAFAQKLGCANLTEVKENIAKLLNDQADTYVQETLREQINEYLLNNYVIDLPRTLVDKEAMFRMRQLTQDQEFQNHWASLGQEERKKTFEMIYTQSAKAVAMFYICRKIVQEQNINISLDDVPPASQNALEILLKPQPQLLHSQHQGEIQRAETLSRLILEKAQDYLIANAEIEAS